MQFCSKVDVPISIRSKSVCVGVDGIRDLNSRLSGLNAVLNVFSPHLVSGFCQQFPFSWHSFQLASSSVVCALYRVELQGLSLDWI